MTAVVDSAQYPNRALWPLIFNLQSPSSGPIRIFRQFLETKFSEVGRLPQHRYGAYDPSPVVSSRTCLASSTNESGTSTSLGPADRKSGTSKPAARWISDGMPAPSSTPSISSATDSSGAAATFTHLSSMYVSYPRLFTEARRRVFRSSELADETFATRR